jgi:hypothetical protein
MKVLLYADSLAQASVTAEIFLTSRILGTAFLKFYIGIGCVEGFMISALSSILSAFIV